MASTGSARNGNQDLALLAYIFTAIAVVCGSVVFSVCAKWFLNKVETFLKERVNNKYIWKPATWVLVHKFKALFTKHPYSMYELKICRDYPDQSEDDGSYAGEEEADERIGSTAENLSAGSGECPCD